MTMQLGNFVVKHKPKRHRNLTPEQKAVRREVYIRAEGRCEGYIDKNRCNRTYHWRGMHYHHKKHKGMGGSKLLDTVDNLEYLCGECHLGKAHGIKEVASQVQWSRKGE